MFPEFSTGPSSSALARVELNEHPRKTFLFTIREQRRWALVPQDICCRNPSKHAPLLHSIIYMMKNLSVDGLCQDIEGEISALIVESRKTAWQIVSQKLIGWNEFAGGTMSTIALKFPARAKANWPAPVASISRSSGAGKKSLI